MEPMEKIRMQRWKHPGLFLSWSPRAASQRKQEDMEWVERGLEELS